MSLSLAAINEGFLNGSIVVVEVVVIIYFVVVFVVLLLLRNVRQD